MSDKKLFHHREQNSEGVWFVYYGDPDSGNYSIVREDIDYGFPHEFVTAGTLTESLEKIVEFEGFVKTMRGAGFGVEEE